MASAEAGIDLGLRTVAVQLPVHSLDVVGVTGDLPHRRQRPQLPFEPLHPRQRVGRLQRVGRAFEHHLEAVDARELAVDEHRRLVQRVRVGEEVDVVRVDTQPRDTGQCDRRHDRHDGQHRAGPAYREPRDGP